VESCGVGEGPHMVVPWTGLGVRNIVVTEIGQAPSLRVRRDTRDCLAEPQLHTYTAAPHFFGQSGLRTGGHSVGYILHPQGPH